MAGEPHLSPLDFSGSRISTPSASPAAYQMFAARQYRRRASCAEVECDHWREGWVSVLDESQPDMKVKADYIRHHSGRVFRQGRTDMGWTQFSFPPGQQCFAAASHQVAADEPAVGQLIVGDHRAIIGTPRTYDRIDQMVDDFATHTDKIRAARSRAGTAG